MRRGGRNLRVAVGILLAIGGGRRGPDPARAGEAAADRGTLVGVVRTADGPAPGARVAVHRHDVAVVDRFGSFDEDAFAARYLHPTSIEPSAPEGVSDEHGRFRLEGLPPGTYEVLARAADGTGAGRLWPAIVSSAREARAEIALGPPAKLSGKVTHADGRPFAGTVFASFESDGTMVPLPFGGIPVPIAGDGTFRFDALPAEPCWVYAVAPGRAAALAFGGKHNAPWEPGSRVDLVMDAGAKRIAVLVVDAGTRAPIADATVRSMTRVEASVLLSEAVTGSDGRASMEGWEKVRVAKPGYLPLEQAVPDAGPRTFELQRGRTVRGIVRGPDGAPLAGVPVHVVGPMDFRVRSTRSGPGGSYEVTGLPVAALGILAFGDDWIPADALALAKEASGALPLDLTREATTSLDLHVVRGAGARLLVESSDRGPIAGATVSVGTPGIGRMGTPIWMTEVLRHEPVETGPDGVVRLGGLLPGFSYSVRATAPGFVASDGEVVPSSEALATATLTLERGRKITIRVRERGTGAPIAGAEVEIHIASEPDAPPRRRADASTGADGRAVFEDLPRGASVCRIEAARHLTTRETWRPIPRSETDAPEVGLDVELERGLTLAGHLRRADGKPLYMPSVQAEPIEAADVRSDRPWRSGQVGADGAFVVEGLAPGRYRLTGEDLLENGEGTSIEVAVEVEAGEKGVTVTLPPPPAPETVRPARLLVRGADGSPVAHASTEIWGRNGSVTGNAVRNGVLELDLTSDCSLAGTQVDLGNASDADGRPLPWGPAHFGPGAPDAREAEVRLPPGVIVEGKVVDPEGRPVGDVELTAHPEAVDADGRPVWRLTWHGIVRTAADGGFRFVGLAAEPYSFELEAPPGLAAGPRARVHAPASGVVIRLDRAVEAVLTVLDASGAPAVGAQVTAQPDGEGIWGRTTVTVDAAGRARLVGLHPSRLHTLDIEPARRSAGMLSYERKEWTARDETVRLERAGTVTGTIVDGDGRPWPGASVRWWLEGKEQRDVVADASGRFVLGDLRPGEIVLSAFGGEGRRDPEPELEGPKKVVAVGATDVTLTALRGVELSVRIAAPDPGAWRGLEAWVSRLDPKEPLGRTTHGVSIGPDGTFRSGPLVPGAPYAIWIPAGRTGLVALKTDVVGAAGELVLSPVAGRTIRGRVVADQPLRSPFRWIDAYGVGWNLRMQLGADGRFELRGVPEGLCVLRAEATVGDAYHTGLLRDVRPGGEDVEVRIGPER